MNLNFENEIKNIKKDLNLGDEVKVYAGNDADSIIRKVQPVYIDKYDISIIDEYRDANGCYLWWQDENTVLVKKSDDYVNLAHELRHAWQHDNQEDGKFYFKKPIKSKRMRLLYNKYVYPVTKTELDANKYANRYAIDKALCNKRPLKAIRNHRIIKLSYFVIGFVQILFCIAWLYGRYQ